MKISQRIFELLPGHEITMADRRTDMDYYWASADFVWRGTNDWIINGLCVNQNEPEDSYSEFCSSN